MAEQINTQTIPSLEGRGEEESQQIPRSSAPILEPPSWFIRCLREKHPRRNTIHMIGNPLITFYCANCELVDFIDTRREDARSERRDAPGYRDGKFASDNLKPRRAD